MKTFEDELLTELKTVVAERTHAEPTVKRRRRLVVGLAAAVTLAAGTAIAVPLIGGDKTTATATATTFSVTRAADGTAQLTITGQDPDELERAFAKTGIKAEVTFLKPGEYCRRTPVGQSSPEHMLIRYWLAFNVAKAGGPGDQLPRPKSRGWTLIVEAPTQQEVRVRPTDGGDGVYGGLGKKDALSVDFLKDGTFGPCVVSR
ncbi:hypothetical protein OHA70_29505 [Kribbella sp. NBC_00382]|uniref:hypothetical protein n=1 Tax=Kribbella sp. NBC_00382 TaxID=2975967 RepID=UPI002E1F126E